MKEKPLVSVCITTYNHEHYIARCIQQVLDQKTNFPFEILIGEDGSTDGTRIKCQEFANQHPGLIRLFLRDRKDVIYIKGRPTGRFNAVQNFRDARGKYIAICDGDDYWNDEYKLQKQVDFLENNPDYSICHHNAYVIRGEENMGMKVTTERSYQLQKFDVGVNILSLSAVFRKKCLHTLPNYFLHVYNADTFIFTHCLMYGPSKFLSTVYPAVYNLSPNSIWSSKSERFRTERSFETFFAIYGYMPLRLTHRYLRRFLHKLHGVQRNQRLTSVTKTQIIISKCLIIGPMMVYYKLLYAHDSKDLI